MDACWLPSVSLHDLSRLGSHLLDRPLEYKGEAAVGVVVLTADWVWQCDSYSSDDVRKTLLGLLPLGLWDVFTFAAHVSMLDDDLDLCIGDNGAARLFPVPPSTLPAVAVIALAPGQSIPTTTYVSLDWRTIREAFLTTVEDSAILLRRQVKKVVQKIEANLNLPVIPAACSDALRIFIAGDRSSVGKSSVCLGIIGTLLEQGFAAKDLAYIKPATQSESTQLIQVFCNSLGIDCVPIGPLVYYRGFTRAFLAGDTPPSDDLLEMCARAVDRIARGKKIVLVDGVGFPAVGSICGTDNATVLKACSYPETMDGTQIERRRNGGDTPSDQSSLEQAGRCDDDDTPIKRRPMGVVLVGGVGVGAAVDAFDLNATYFESKQVPVLGAIFNKLPLTGFYSLDNCREQITRYFALQKRDRGGCHGFVPVFPDIANTERGVDVAFDFIKSFAEHVDVAGILSAASKVKGADVPLARILRAKKVASTVATGSYVEKGQQPPRRLRTRQEIELEAVNSGAKKSA